MTSFKITFCFFILIAMPFCANLAHAQNTSGADILRNIVSGGTTLQEGSQTLAASSPLNATQSQNLITQMFNGSALNANSGGTILDGFMNGNLNASNLADIQTTIQNFDTSNITQVALNGVVNNLASGALPPDLASAISNFDLGNLTSMANIEQLFQLPAVDQFMTNLLANGGAPEDILELASNITQLGLDPSQFANVALGAITQAVSDALQNALPAVFADVLAQMGVTSLLNSLGLSILSDFSGAGSITIPGSGAGNYEIFPRDPKSSPVSKSCNGVCNCTCQAPIERNHMTVRAHVTDELIQHRTWMIDELFRLHILPAMMMMTNQLSAVSMNSTFAIGKFFDAKTQMETERTLQVLSAEAQKDYQLSEGICEIGTNVRYLAGSERKSNLVQTALAKRVNERISKNENTIGSQGPDSNVFSRIFNFKERYCNVNDNAQGLSWLCQNPTSPERRNKDINATRVLFSQNTLDADFVNIPPAPGPSGSPTPAGQPARNNDDAEDLFALTTNLFSPTLNPEIGKFILATPDGHARAEAFDYMNLRSVMAKRSVAANTFAALSAERAAGVENYDPSFLKRIVEELGIPEPDVETLLGINPSYYAQRKVLTSYAFENPTFYTQLYESPANIARKDTALKALGLMLEDDFYDRQLESEVTLAIMLEVMLEDEHTRASGALLNLNPAEDD